MSSISRGSKYRAACSAVSGKEAARAQITGTPQAIASTTPMPNPSYIDGITTKSAPA
jgi:hypothetical protein